MTCPRSLTERDSGQRGESLLAKAPPPYRFWSGTAVTQKALRKFAYRLARRWGPPCRPPERRICLKGRREAGRGPGVSAGRRRRAHRDLAERLGRPGGPSAERPPKRASAVSGARGEGPRPLSVCAESLSRDFGSTIFSSGAAGNRAFWLPAKGRLREGAAPAAGTPGHAVGRGNLPAGGGDSVAPFLTSNVVPAEASRDAASSSGAFSGPSTPPPPPLTAGPV